MTENEIEFNLYTMPSVETMTEALGQIGIGAVILPVTVATWLDRVSVTVIVTP